jgi:hypothetical protein
MAPTEDLRLQVFVTPCNPGDGFGAASIDPQDQIVSVDHGSSRFRAARK